jgi:hypothetical protein
LVVGDIVTHIGLRRLVHGREPDDIDSELVQVGDLGKDTLECAVTIGGMISEGCLRVSNKFIRSSRDGRTG